MDVAYFDPCESYRRQKGGGGVRLVYPTQVHVLKNSSDISDEVDEHINNTVMLPTGEAEYEYTWKDVKISPHLTDDQTRAVQNLLRTYQVCFTPVEKYPNPKLPAFSQQTIRIDKGVAPWQYKLSGCRYITTLDL